MPRPTVCVQSPSQTGPIEAVLGEIFPSGENQVSIARTALAATLLGLAFNASAGLSDVPSGHYGLDKPHGYITFSYSHMGFSNPHVGFKSFTVDLTSTARTQRTARSMSPSMRPASTAVSIISTAT